MYTKILVPLDGSAEAEAAGRQAVELAELVGASVVAVHVAPPFQSRYFGQVAPLHESARDLWEAGLRSLAERHFHSIRTAAQDRSVPVATIIVFDERPAEAIRSAALVQGCNLIAMGPRGHDAAPTGQLGSVTARVLAATVIPVLVHRDVAV